jgi:hypothetical protein
VHRVGVGIDVDVRPAWMNARALISGAAQSFA